MNEKLQLYKQRIVGFWKDRTLTQKSVLIGAIIALFLLVIGVSMFASNPKMVPLYNNLSLQEVGKIQTELEARGVKNEIANGGTTILVPEKQSESLLVQLAAQGLPDGDGNIDYSFFSKNTSWGVTDNEFNVIKLDAMQTELANLIKSIDGIQDAKVMINKPKDPIFVGDAQESASASIVIHTQPGYQLKGNQVQALYKLVSKSVPNLPTDNIVIMNQNFEYFDLENQNSYANGNVFATQQNVKKDIERDIQRRVQQMLGAMVGSDKVIVSVTADVDFTQENQTKDLVEPVNLETMEGLPVSVDRVTETYKGNPPNGGNPGAETGGDVPGYVGQDKNSSNGDYSMVKETINNEFNRIHKNIVESPYKIRDLGIQVAVDNTKEQKGTAQTDVAYLSQEEQKTVRDGITSILSSIVSTSISKDYGQVNPQDKISIVFQEFNGKPEFNPTTTPVIPMWMYIVGGVLLAVIIGLLWVLLRRRKQVEEEFEEVNEYTAVSVPDIDEEHETEGSLRRKQLERMAKDKPEDFAKLLRTWIAED